MGEVAGQLAVRVGLGEEVLCLLLEGGHGVGAGWEAQRWSVAKHTSPKNLRKAHGGAPVSSSINKRITGSRLSDERLDMTTEAMERAFSEMPEGNASLLASAKSHLLNIAQDVPEEIIGIVCASPSISGNSALVITPSRIIEMTTGGAMQVLTYSELSAVQSVGGKKKRFGGHEQILLRVISLDGGVRTYPLFGSHEWNSRLGAAAESACQRSRLQQN